MLRDLATLLDELHDGLVAVEASAGVRLVDVSIALPLELRPVFRDGGCRLLADVARNRDLGSFHASPSVLRVSWTGADRA